MRFTRKGGGSGENDFLTVELSEGGEPKSPLAIAIDILIKEQEKISKEKISDEVKMKKNHKLEQTILESEGLEELLKNFLEAKQALEKSLNKSIIFAGGLRSFIISNEKMKEFLKARSRPSINSSKKIGTAIPATLVYRDPVDEIKEEIKGGKSKKIIEAVSKNLNEINSKREGLPDEVQEFIFYLSLPEDKKQEVADYISGHKVVEKAAEKDVIISLTETNWSALGERFFNNELVSSYLDENKVKVLLSILKKHYDSSQGMLDVLHSMMKEFIFSKDIVNFTETLRKIKETIVYMKNIINLGKDVKLFTTDDYIISKENEIINWTKEKASRLKEDINSVKKTIKQTNLNPDVIEE